MNFKGTKKVEIPYFLNRLSDDKDKSILIAGECGGFDKISESLYDRDFKNVTTTDIRPIQTDSWLDNNAKEWNHIKVDYIELDEKNKFDYIIAISTFEHFGLFWENTNMFDSGADDMLRWNHDLRAIEKSCRLLKDDDSKIFVTLPIGNYMNYDDRGFPIVRYYNIDRRNLILDSLSKENCVIEEETFYHSQNFEEWYESDVELMTPKYNHIHNLFTPNSIWGFTIKRI
tara:strand:+ start:217 stop:903 length:687 start_codon:yes stop_codon:yes gene_type:complete